MKIKGSIILLVYTPGVVSMSTFWINLFTRAGVYYANEGLNTVTKAAVKAYLSAGVTVCLAVTLTQLEKDSRYLDWDCEIRRIDYVQVKLGL